MEELNYSGGIHRQTELAASNKHIVCTALNECQRVVKDIGVSVTRNLCTSLHNLTLHVHVCMCVRVMYSIAQSQVGVVQRLVGGDDAYDDS